ncbi:hypothetical protein IWX90DRAFT_293562 [Phyllosticta citrichinensis]|uniref:Uncharacterized protein n=1 Tax=Phyllosticta citrichinensis TaxID=1130410 RepID=A0ABR1XK84_9PEZI
MPCHAMPHADAEWKERFLPSCWHARTHGSTRARQRCASRQVESSFFSLSQLPTAPLAHHASLFGLASRPPRCTHWRESRLAQCVGNRRRFLSVGCVCLNCSALPPRTLCRSFFLALASSSNSPSPASNSLLHLDRSVDCFLLAPIHTTFNFFSTPRYPSSASPSPYPIHSCLIHHSFLLSSQAEQSSGAWNITNSLSLFSLLFFSFGTLACLTK